MVPVPLIIALVGSAAGLLFASVSTYDFVAHLDRQVHGLHCSLLPGIGTPDATGTSGCHVTLMSPYSSVLRESVWGGIPISLPAMAVFAFLLFWGALLWLTNRTRDERATGFYALATGVPALTSLVMAIISLSALDAVCKVCLGIYLSSILCVVGAVLTWLRARRAAGQPVSMPGEEAQRMSLGALGVAFLVGCLFVTVSVVAYAASAPNFEKYAGTCGKLAKLTDPSRVLVPLGGQGTGPQVLEVLDPLCPACRAFERRFSGLSISETANRQAMLFPLDSSCNWMVESAVHPGACSVSEAMLCAGDKARDVLEWAFEEQENIVAAEKAQAGSAAKLAVAKFPSLAGCVGSTKIKARLNKALRWAVDNQLPVLTPQLYVNGTRLCDADTDLGLDYMLARLAEKPSAGTP
ncbi:MAG: vitamin K epoxide reductase family protein [Myxococcales bacterium]